MWCDFSLGNLVIKFYTQTQLKVVWADGRMVTMIGCDCLHADNSHLNIPTFDGAYYHLNMYSDSKREFSFFFRFSFSMWAVATKRRFDCLLLWWIIARDRKRMRKNNKQNEKCIRVVRLSLLLWFILNSVHCIFY